jgi:hypothetical protein
MRRACDRSGTPSTGATTHILSRTHLYETRRTPRRFRDPKGRPSLGGATAHSARRGDPPVTCSSYQHERRPPSARAFPPVLLPLLLTANSPLLPPPASRSRRTGWESAQGTLQYGRRVSVVPARYRGRQATGRGALGGVSFHLVHGIVVDSKFFQPQVDGAPVKEDPTGQTAAAKVALKEDKSVVSQHCVPTNTFEPG